MDEKMRLAGFDFSTFVCARARVVLFVVKNYCKKQTIVV